jgi:hypothetical protein
VNQTVPRPLSCPAAGEAGDFPAVSGTAGAETIPHNHGWPSAGIHNTVCPVNRPFPGECGRPRRPRTGGKTSRVSGGGRFLPGSGWPPQSRRYRQGGVRGSIAAVHEPVPADTRFRSTRPLARGRFAAMAGIPGFPRAFPKRLRGSIPASRSATAGSRLPTKAFLRSLYRAGGMPYFADFSPNPA